MESVTVNEGAHTEAAGGHCQRSSTEHRDRQRRIREEGLAATLTGGDEHDETGKQQGGETEESTRPSS